MAKSAGKRGHEWLDADLDEGSYSEAEEDGYDSEAAEERKGEVRDKKRRRTEDVGFEREDEEVYEDEDEGEEEDGIRGEEDADGRPIREENNNGDKSGTDSRRLEPAGLSNDIDVGLVRPSVSADTKLSLSSNPNLKPLTPAQLEAHNRRLRNTGVIYISRVPPYMSPAKVRSLLSPYGALGRVFLTPESAQSHTTRVRSHGNRKKSFVDGWVEFSSKRDAKLAAETLNAQIIGGKKGGWYHDDLWNIKYLKGFKWADLVEQVRNEEAERASRLRVGRERGRREEKEFIKGVERAKVWEGKERKRKDREERSRKTADGRTRLDMSGAQEADYPAGTNQDRQNGNDTRPKSNQQFTRTFRQNAVKAKSGDGTSKSQSQQHQQPEQVKRVLSKIF